MKQYYDKKSCKLLVKYLWNCRWKVYEFLLDLDNFSENLDFSFNFPNELKIFCPKEKTISCEKEYNNGKMCFLKLNRYFFLLRNCYWLRCHNKTPIFFKLQKPVKLILFFRFWIKLENWKRKTEKRQESENGK